MKSAGIVCVGNEILSGAIRDANGPRLVDELRDLGVTVRLVLQLPDEVEPIAAGIRFGLDRAEALLVTGGIGPTHDDVTFAGIARALDVPLENEPELVDLLEQFYGPEIPDAVQRMARVPRGSILRHADDSSFPLLQVDRIFVFPGEPRFVARQIEAFRDVFRGPGPFHRRRLRLSVDETEVTDVLAEVEEAHDVQVGAYPRFDESTPERLVVTVESRDRDAVRTASRALLSRIPADDVLPAGDDPGS